MSTSSKFNTTTTTSFKHGARSGPGHLYRTRLCKYGLRCDYGVKCYYAHSENELRQRMGVSVVSEIYTRDGTDRETMPSHGLKRKISDAEYIKIHPELMALGTCSSSSTISSNNESALEPPCPPPMSGQESRSSTCDDTSTSSGNSVVSPPSVPHIDYYGCVVRLMQQHSSWELHRILTQAQPAYYTD